jgi:hypothetical protein
MKSHTAGGVVRTGIDSVRVPHLTAPAYSKNVQLRTCPRLVRTTLRRQMSRSTSLRRCMMTSCRVRCWQTVNSSCKKSRCVLH